MRLAAIRIAEREMHAGEFFVLQQDADELREMHVGAKGEFADAVAVFVGVAIAPEFRFKVFAIAGGFCETARGDFEPKRRLFEIAVFSAEVISGGAVAYKRAIDFRGRSEHFASRK